jgi:hypothetical protein
MVNFVHWSFFTFVSNPDAFENNGDVALFRV